MIISQGTVKRRTVREGFGAAAWGAALALMMACAGGDTPLREGGFEQKVGGVYAPELLGGAGSASMSGAGGGAGTGGGGGSAGTGGGSSGGTGGGSSGSGGVSGGGASGSTGGGDYCDAPSLLYIACGIGSGCHGSDSPVGDFGASEAAARALVDVPGTRAGCGSYIDSANPDDSLIMTKVDGTAGAQCGLPMPFGLDPLEQEEQDCIRDWLSQF